MTQTVALTSGAEELRAIAGAVVTHDALGFDAQESEVSQSVLKKEGGAVLAFLRHDLSESETRCIINADVDVFPADAADLIAPVVSDTVARANDLAQLLDIEVEQFAWELALVAHDRRSRLHSALNRERPLWRTISKPRRRKRRSASTTAT